MHEVEDIGVSGGGEMRVISLPGGSRSESF